MTILFAFRFDSNLPASCVVGCPNRSTRIPQFHRHHVVERSCWTAGPKRPCPGTVRQISTESRNIFKSRNILNLVGSMVKAFEIRPFKQFGTFVQSRKTLKLKDVFQHLQHILAHQLNLLQGIFRFPLLDPKAGRRLLEMNTLNTGGHFKEENVASIHFISNAASTTVTSTTTTTTTTNTTTQCSLLVPYYREAK